jgi:hypothetical protein
VVFRDLIGSQHGGIPPLRPRAARNPAASGAA